jgi:HEAT repeat protein
MHWRGYQISVGLHVQYDALNDMCCVEVSLTAMLGPDTITQLVEKLAVQNDDIRRAAAAALGSMAQHGAISLPPHDHAADRCYAEHLQDIMIEVGAVKTLVEMLRSQKDDIQNSAAYVLSKISAHGAITNL